MKKPVPLTLMLVLAVLAARGQNCNQVVINNGMSSYQSVSTDGVNISASAVTSGSDTMSPPPGCPPFNGGQPPGSPRHTANASVTISSGSSNKLQNPNFTSGTAGWQWQQNPGGGGGWVLGQGGLPSPPGGIGNLAVFQGIGTAAVANLQHISVDPGNAVTASVWGLGEPGALGQALLRVDWYGATGNLISVTNSPVPVTNNYVWTQVRFSATAPAGATYAVVDFAIIGKTTATGRWFAYGFVATLGQTTTSSYAGCWDCYLSASAADTQPIGDDTDWTVNFNSETICSSAGLVFSALGSINPTLTTTYGWKKSQYKVTTGCGCSDYYVGTYSPQCTNGAIYASCPNGIKQNPLTTTWDVPYTDPPGQLPYQNVITKFLNFQLGGNQCIQLTGYFKDPQQAPSNGGPCN
jgi:hypothetical protein